VGWGRATWEVAVSGERRGRRQVSGKGERATREEAVSSDEEDDGGEG
jgi:hypothetical protein